MGVKGGALYQVNTKIYLLCYFYGFYQYLPRFLEYFPPEIKRDTCSIPLDILYKFNCSVVRKNYFFPSSKNSV